MNIFCDNCTTLDHQVRIQNPTTEIQNPRSKDDWRYGVVKGEIMNKFCDNCTTLGHQVRIPNPFDICDVGLLHLFYNYIGFDSWEVIYHHFLPIYLVGQ